VGFDDGQTISNDVVKINLHQPNEMTTLKQIPIPMEKEATAAVFNNMIYVAGIGVNNDEIWKCKKSAGWMRCTSLVQGRRGHSAAFIDEVLYICGGYVDSTELVLHSVEAFNALSNQCTAVGKLIHAVRSTGNCVPYRNSLYIFGGSDKDDNNVNHVQLYNTRENTCSLISTPMPRPYRLMRAILWETYVILLGQYNCFIFDIETEKWQERKHFKTDVAHFGLILENGRLFVIGGGVIKRDEDGDYIWKCRDDVRYVPLQNILDNKPIK